MGYGNAEYNRLFAPDKKTYACRKEDVDPANTNNSHSLVVNQVRPNSVVLDVGCSTGFLGEWLIEHRQCTVYGIEVDQDAVNEVKRHKQYKDIFNIDLDCLQADQAKLAQLNQLQGMCDHILCADILEHLKNPTEALCQLSRLLKNDGSIIVSVPNVANIDIVLNLFCQRFNYSQFGLLDNDHLRFFTRESFFQWIDSINQSERLPYRLVCQERGVTVYRSETVGDIEKNYPRFFQLLFGDHPQADVFQYMFVLTLEPMKSKPTESEQKSAFPEPYPFFLDKREVILKALEEQLANQEGQVKEKNGELLVMQEKLGDVENQLREYERELNAWRTSKIGKIALRFGFLKK